MSLSNFDLSIFANKLDNNSKLKLSDFDLSNARGNFSNKPEKKYLSSLEDDSDLDFESFHKTTGVKLINLAVAKSKDLGEKLSNLECSQQSEKNFVLKIQISFFSLVLSLILKRFFSRQKSKAFAKLRSNHHQIKN